MGRLHRRSNVALACVTWCAVAVLAGGCTPTVQVGTEEPITINMNVNIQHEIRVKVDRELEQIFSEDSELF